MEWILIEGMQAEKPQEVDKESSHTTVYLRRNIEQITKTDEDGNTYKAWQYEERTMTKSDYAIYAAEQNMNDLIEAEQEITDMDLRIMELENAQEGE